jgi:single-strand DNA-binding protein
MADINHVVLVGRLTRDAELKYTAGGQAVCKFSVAVNRRRKNGDQWEDEANYFDIVLWGRQGESLNQYLVKGKSVGVEGELRQDRWQQDGQNRSKVEIVANNIQLLGGSSGSGGSTGSLGTSGSYSGNGHGDGGSHTGNQGSWHRKGGDNPPPSDDNFTDDIPF